MKLIEYPDREMLAIDVANVMAGELENCLLRHESASMAVPGGTTPGPIFDTLCAADLDWSGVKVMLTDERWVPEGHERSNASLLRSRLLTDRAAAAQFLPFYVEGQRPEDAAGPLSDQLASEMPISLLLLGMGTDMHTASLFPGAEGLEAGLDEDAPILVPIRAEGQEPRISLSAAALNGAMSKHLVIFGSDKRDALMRARELPPQKAPIAAVLGDLTVHWAE
ncbi:MAG: 6-phosphogluconolactonase [Pseudomonadota bacterium]